jgi:hypothetical protein
MPSPPTYSRIIARSDAPDPSTTNTIIISAVLACFAAILVIAMLVKYVGLPWWHGHKTRKAVKEKAIADRKAWYRSTRPIMRRPETPRIVNFYSRSPHIQGHQEVRSSAITPLDDSNDSNACGNSDVLEPFPDLDLDHQPRMESWPDLGLQLMDKHHTGTTMSTVISVGAADPLLLPSAMSATEVYTGRYA